MNTSNKHHREILQSIAHRAMLDRGLLPDFSAAALAELGRIQGPAVAKSGDPVRDLRDLLWASIDNDDSLDLDQLTVAEAMPRDNLKILVAIADVDALVKNGSAIDQHARHNTTSVYTAAEIFSMLPERLSTDLTSLGFDEDRLSIVVETEIGADGSLQDSDIYRARVCNHAQLAYNSVTAWLEGGGVPEAVVAVNGLAENLRLQDRAAQRMKNFRHVHGALSLQTIEAKPIFDSDQIRDLQVEEKNRAKEIIEDFMIAANGVTARYLSSRHLPLIRRVVRTPRRWERMVEIAGEHGFRLPDRPDSKALEAFLIQEKAADPLRFPDLITQRLLKAAIEGKPLPYRRDELEALAKHCTEQEDAANKVERQVGKSAAALLLRSRIGERFDALVTGASSKGTWVRLLNVPVEGKLVQGFEGVDVGDRMRVQLIGIDVERGYIDFRQVGSSRD